MTSRYPAARGRGLGAAGEREPQRGCLLAGGVTEFQSALGTATLTANMITVPTGISGEWVAIPC